MVNEGRILSISDGIANVYGPEQSGLWRNA